MRKETVSKKDTPRRRSPVIDKALHLACGAMRLRDCDLLEVAEALEEKAAECRRQASAEAGEWLNPVHRTAWFATKLIQDWHRLPQFVDQAGAPRPLKMWGTADSIESIARLRVASPRGVKAVVQCLKQMSGCRRAGRGRYLPKGYALIFDQQRDVLEQHGQRLFACLIETIENNIRESNPALRDFERVAHCERLALEHLPAFRHFMDAQGMALLETVDQWLHEREARLGKPSVEVIVELFAHAAHTGGMQIGKVPNAPYMKEAGTPGALRLSTDFESVSAVDPVNRKGRQREVS